MQQNIKIINSDKHKKSGIGKLARVVCKHCFSAQVITITKRNQDVKCIVCGGTFTVNP